MPTRVLLGHKTYEITALIINSQGGSFPRKKLKHMTPHIR
jgi:hypothetical protein